MTCSSSIPLRPNIEERVRNIIRGDVPWSLRYLNEFFYLKCGPDLFELRLFPNPKEVTESFGAYNAYRKHLNKKFDPKDETIGLISVGDGNTPRTAAIFAFLTKWKCLSIDPQLKEKEWKISRLSTAKLRIEESKEVIYSALKECNKILIVCVHSHANLDSTMRIVNKALPNVENSVISIQCCIPQIIKDNKPNFEYRDWSILSPENLVKVWLNGKRKEA